MISTAVVSEVKRLVAQGDLSQREIARLTGIGRSTVSNIVQGRWVDRPCRLASDKDRFPRPSGSPARCPTCGGRVYLPCLLCHVRQLKAKRGHGGGETRCAST